jgi:hypothetical protein
MQHTIGKYKVIVIYHPFVYRAPLRQPDELDGMSYALTGDVMDRQMPTIIDWPRDLLDSVTTEGVAVTVPTAQAAVNYFDANLGAQWLPPVVPVNEQQEIGRGIFCPTFLAQVLMTKAMLTREAFSMVLLELARKNLIVECQDILQWFLVTCTKEGQAAVPAAGAAAVGGATGLVDDEPMIVPPPAPAASPPAGTAAGVPRTASKYFQQVPVDAGRLREVMERVHRELPGLTAAGDPEDGHRMDRSPTG